LNKVKVILILLFSLVSLLEETNAQAPSVGGNTQREEIQRYFGYEILPYRYLSLPYDVTVNCNENALAIEIGFIYLVFLPLLLLLYFFDRTRLRIFIFFCIIFLWVIGTSNSNLFSFEGKLYESEKYTMAEYLLGPIPFMSDPTAHITAYVYYLSSFIYEPLLSLAEKFSGNKDIVTYPLLVLLLLLSSRILYKELQQNSRTIQALVIVFWIFFFLWLKFSAGIIWYGFMMFILGLILIIKLLVTGNLNYPFASKVLRICFYGLSILWVLSAVLLRFGEVQNNATQEELGKAMYNHIFYNYQIGEIDEFTVLQSVYPGDFDKALARINSEKESKILRIGTSFSYFIKNNSSRVFIDNQLGLFEKVREGIRDKEEVIEAFEGSGFKYIIVDVNTPYIDDTPEKSLKTKYDRLMYICKDNPKLKLLSTNRVFSEILSNGTQKLYYRMFPDKSRNMKIFYGGQYAIFEIIP